MADVNPGPEVARTDQLACVASATSGRTRFGLVFGGIVGLFSGPLVALACCYFVDAYDYVWRCVQIALPAGFVSGALVGYTGMRRARGAESPDIATHVCISHGLVFAVLVGLASLGGVAGTFSLHFAVGIAFLGPMVGMMIGAMLDRSVEASQAKRWREAFGFIIIALTVAGGITYLLLVTPWGEDTSELARHAKIAMLREWRKDPEVRKPSIQNINLLRESGNTYRGTVDATLDGQAERFELLVKVHGDRFFFRWQPLHE